MMIQAAGGPGVVPIEFGQRRRPIPKWVLGAVAASALLHLAGGAWLYFQRYETPVAAPTQEPPPISLEFFKPRPEPKPLPPTAEPPAPPTPVHQTPLRATTVEPLPATPSDTATPSDSTIINTTPTEVFAPTGTGTAPAVQPTAPPVIVRPDWVRKPSGEQLMRAYPSAAIRTNATGAATLNCAVRVDGTLTDCSVRSETPGGLGFGRAALSLSRYFRMSPQSVNGQAVDGARVNVTTRFTLPEN